MAGCRADGFAEASYIPGIHSNFDPGFQPLYIVDKRTELHNRLGEISAMQPDISAFLDPITETISYVIRDPATNAAAIIDPVLDFDPRSGCTHTTAADLIANHINKHALRVEWILETHAHADHLSGAQILRERIGGKVAIGGRITEVQNIFSKVFNLPDQQLTEANGFDHLFEDDEIFQIGQLQARALAVPGHTIADMAYQIGDAVFVGDTLFMPDVGTARCDFPSGNARALYRSIHKLFSLPASTRLFMCHDYPPAGREHRWETTVAQQRAENIHIHEGVSEEQFVDMRNQRDAGLEMPTLIIPSIQVNIRAGHLPEPEANGVSYLKVPLNTL